MSKKLTASFICVAILGATVAATLYLATRAPVRNMQCMLRIKQTGVSESSLLRANQLLKSRKDREALQLFETMLSVQPDSIDAMWGKAEVLRRSRDYQQSETLIQEILKQSPRHIPSLITLCYIRYKEDQLDDASKIIDGVFQDPALDRENRALAYTMLGAISSRRAQKGGLLSKIKFGTKIKGYFMKAKELSPDLAEAHVGLGSYYLLAPAIAGGNTDKAIAELKLALKLAPDFATASARLAQAYKKEGDMRQFETYLSRAQKLDPENEVLKEIAQNP